TRQRDVTLRVKAAGRGTIVSESATADRAGIAAKELAQRPIDAAALVSRQPGGRKLGAAHDAPRDARRAGVPTSFGLADFLDCFNSAISLEADCTLTVSSFSFGPTAPTSGRCALRTVASLRCLAAARRLRVELVPTGAVGGDPTRDGEAPTGSRWLPGPGCL